MGSSPSATLMQEDREKDLKYLARSLELAELGRGQVSPSPLVGCVVLDKNGEVVGEGTYFFEDVVHAEIVALRQAGEKASGGTAYVSLEPHAHHGRTRPCTEALVEAGIKRVVAPIEDPNPLVSGKGFEFLKENGVIVDVGLLGDEAKKQNEAFIVWHQEKRPFVHLKLATSLDGKIATRTGSSQWITGPESRTRVQELRHGADAILVGANTVREDNPSLTDRSDGKRHRDLVRVVLAGKRRIDLQSKVFDGTAPTLVFSDTVESVNNAETIAVSAWEIEKVLSVLYEKEVQTVLVEGGGEIAASFIESGLVDRITFFIAPILIGGTESKSSIAGVGASDISEAYKLQDVETRHHGTDLEITGVVTRNS